jgi:hypothetical protein|uniref:Uncharacterized protein n=1 Tax=viral metagenome TaxID=1070528 RepID=A0A6C0C1Z8_9ZZZZ
MVVVILVNKFGIVNEKNVNINNLNDLYKKCGLNNNNYFDKHHTWKQDDNYISLYAKNNGRANTENKYDFPPPCDNLLFFGNVLLVKHTNEEIFVDELLDLSKDEWDTFYQKCFGGFESLGDEDSSEDELENVPEEEKTKDGYLKDGFVVDSDEDSPSSNNSNLSNNSDEESYASDSDVSELNSEDELSEESYLSD